VVALLPGLVVGLKDPHVPTGVQLQVTPLLVESLATVAVIEVWLRGAKVVGIVLSVIMMPGGVVSGELLLLLQATRAAIKLRLSASRIDLRNVIGHLR
jgi:hypothetical protein